MECEVRGDSRCIHVLDTTDETIKRKAPSASPLTKKMRRASHQALDRLLGRVQHMDATRDASDLEGRNDKIDFNVVSVASKSSFDSSTAADETHFFPPTYNDFAGVSVCRLTILRSEQDVSSRTRPPSTAGVPNATRRFQNQLTSPYSWSF
jgi:hypothetical protein